MFLGSKFILQNSYFLNIKLTDALEAAVEFSQGWMVAVKKTRHYSKYKLVLVLFIDIEIFIDPC